MSSKTRSFRCDDVIWQLIENTAQKQGKSNTDVLLEAVVGHVGNVIKQDKRLSAQQLVKLMSQVQSIEAEMAAIKQVLGQNNDEKGKSK